MGFGQKNNLYGLANDISKGQLRPISEVSAVYCAWDNEKEVCDFNFST